MNDGQEAPDALPHHRPDRAIETAAEDRLDRGPFVSRLARALVRNDHKASGVVVGLTGPWGTGKSSILKLLKAEIEAQHPGAVVLPFDPWLVSGRDDVITQFFAELLARIKTVGTRNPQTRKVVTQLTGRLTKYAANLAPTTALLGLPIPGLREAMKAVGEALDRTESLADQHADLKTCLEGVEVPIVVLIDELDRVEDTEVRAVAQLVRAVADFPGISYLLAYDRMRVVEALGGVDKDRGARYLEKIVQLEIPLPFIGRAESEALFVAEFERAAAAAGLPSDWRSSRRYRRLIAIAQRDGLLDTPRDIRRICAAYAALGPMVEDEVDWVDLLGYTILLAKDPVVVDSIRRRPDLVVYNANQGRSFAEDWEEMVQDDDQDVAGRNLAALGLNRDAPVRRLLTFLFPMLRTRDDREEAEEHEVPRDGLRDHRPLMTVLRLGAVPGMVSRAEVTSWLALDEAGKSAGLKQSQEEGRLEAFMNRLLAAYPDLQDPAPEQTLSAFGMAPLLVPAGAEIDVRQALSACKKFDQLCHLVTKGTPGERNADRETMVRTLLGKLIAAGSYDAPSLILHRFSFPSGGGFHKSDHGEDFLTPTDASSLSDQIREAICQLVTEGRWRAEIRTGWPLIVASGHSQWNDSRERLTEELARDEHALRAWTILLYGGMRGEKKRIDRIVDAEVVGEKLRSATPSLWSSPAAAFALRNAREGLRV